MNATHAGTDWPALRRLAWYVLFLALLGWGSLVHPASGVTVEPLPVVGVLES